MIYKTTAAAYELARRRAEISKIRYEYAKADPSRFTDKDMDQLKKEMNDDEIELQDIQNQLKTDIAKIQDVLARRIAYDHYLVGMTVSELAKHYNFSNSSIKRYLRMARCSE